MKYSSAIIVRHMVAAATSKDLGVAVEYFTREGRFKERGGIERTVTDADRRLTAVEALVGYNSRSGPFAGRGEDRPLAAGDRTGECFGQFGLVDVASLAEEIERSGSHVVKSIVSVRREDAHELGMVSKRDFENFMRLNWRAAAERWGVIEGPDICWVAFMHVDTAHHHLHVITWDKTGEWGRHGRPWLPDEGMNRARRELQAKLLRPFIEERDRERTYCRDAAVSRIRCQMGRPPADDEWRKIAAREEGAALPRPIKAQTIPAVEAREIAEGLRAASPDGRVLEWQRCSPKMRKVLERALGRLMETDPAIRELAEAHARAVEDATRARGVPDALVDDHDGHVYNPLRRHIDEEACELRRRMCNAIVAAMRERELPHAERSGHGREQVRTQADLGRPGAEERQEEAWRGHGGPGVLETLARLAQEVPRPAASRHAPRSSRRIGRDGEKARPAQQFRGDGLRRGR